ncbi:DMT family transporter [Tumebacillus sp. ITR2]|uniref:DMT family transporter n=1 Tax=Tumebacillus amylolyticus TaxID=2801339 RepID=A0ABS1JDC5_9BACL|nr:DMT family transporter [Tumebacillus amylolyticus]MBL0388230.1 DMT family transporter [Tumebacillus amylolyticus]
MDKYKAWLILVLCNLFWAGNYIFGKYVVAEMTPLWMTTARWLGALVLLVPLAQIFERPQWKQVFRHWFLLLCMGLLGSVMYNFTLYEALQFTSSTSAAFVQALNPAVLVVFAMIFLRERLQGKQWAGLLVSLVGVVVLLCKGDWNVLLQAEYNRGDLLMVVAVVVWSVYTLLSKKASGIPPIAATAVSTFFSVVVMLPFALAQGFDASKLTSVGMMGMAYIVLFPSVGSYILWSVGVRAIGPSQAGVFLNFIPLFTALISLLLGQSITFSQVLGGGLILLGVYFTSRRQEKIREEFNQ